MRRFIHAMRFPRVSKTVGRFAIYTFFLSLVMTLVAVVSVGTVRIELTSIFDTAAKMRAEQLSNHYLLETLLSANARLMQAVVRPDGSHERALREDLKQLGVIKQRFDSSSSARGADYGRLTLALDSSLARIQAAADTLATQGRDAAGLPEQLDALAGAINQTRQELAAVDETLAGALEALRNRARSTVALLLGALGFLALGLILSSFAQLRDLALQAASFVTREENSSRAIGSLEQEVAESRVAIDAVNRQLAITLRSAGVQVFTVDLNGHVNWVADSNSRLAAMNRTPFLLFDAVEPAAREALAKGLNEVIVRGQSHHLEARLADERGDDLWVRLHFTPEQSADNGPALGCAIDITELKLREQNTFWLMRELSHRSKNLLAVIQSIAGQTARSTERPEQFVRRLSQRLRALAASHDLLVDTDYSGAPLDALIRSQLHEVSGLLGRSVHLEGPEVSVRAEAAQPLGMAFHELCTNALAHGALQHQNGRVDIRWSLSGRLPDERLLIEWRESGAGDVVAPHKSGFGTSLITRHLSRALEGEVSLDHQPEGTLCRMDLPMRNVQARLLHSEQHRA